MKAGRHARTISAPTVDSKLVHAMAALAFLAAFVPHMPLLAQGLDNPKAIDTIIGSDVETQRESAADDQDSIVDAINATSQSISKVRKSFSLDKVEIVFVPDSKSDKAIKDAIDAHEAGIAELRETIEGNAMFFHAVDSRKAALSDIIAVSFDGDSSVKIYTAGKPLEE